MTRPLRPSTKELCETGRILRQEVPRSALATMASGPRDPLVLRRRRPVADADARRAARATRPLRPVAARPARAARPRRHRRVRGFLPAQGTLEPRLVGRGTSESTQNDPRRARLPASVPRTQIVERTRAQVVERPAPRSSSSGRRPRIETRGRDFVPRTQIVE